MSEKVKPIKFTPSKAKVTKAVRAQGDGDPPSLDSLFAVAPSPLDTLDYPGDLEGDVSAEMGAVESFIKEERLQERERWRLMTDTNFYCCLVFQSEQQRDDFLAQVGWADLGPRYLNGLAVAQRLGVPIAPIALPRKPIRPMPKALRGVPVIPKKEN